MIILNVLFRNVDCLELLMSNGADHHVADSFGRYCSRQYSVYSTEYRLYTMEIQNMKTSVN